MEPQWFPRDPQAALLAELGLAYSGLEGAAQMLFACLFFYISPDAPGGDPPNPLKKYISSICWAFDLSFVANYLFRWKHGVPFYWTCQKVLGWCRSWWCLACPTNIFKNLDKWFKIIQTIWDAFVGATAAGSVSEDIRTNILGLDILSYKYYKHRYTKKRMKHWRTIPTGKMISTFWNLGISQCIPELFFWNTLFVRFCFDIPRYSRFFFRIQCFVCQFFFWDGWISSSVTTSNKPQIPYNFSRWGLYLNEFSHGFSWL